MAGSAMRGIHNETHEVHFSTSMCSPNLQMREKRERLTYSPNEKWQLRLNSDDDNEKRLEWDGGDKGKIGRRNCDTGTISSTFLDAPSYCASVCWSVSLFVFH